MKHPILSLFSGLFFSLFFSIAYAACPAASDVTYVCDQSGVHCNWTADWYEGSPDKNAHVGDKAASFNYVFWKEAGVNGDGMVTGAVDCMYNSPEGNLIQLMQNDFGKVPLPQYPHWVNYGGSRSCVAGDASDCKFDNYH